MFFWNNGSFSAAPHLSLPSAGLARRRSITLQQMSTNRPGNKNAFSRERGEERERDSECKYEIAVFTGRFVPPAALTSQIVQLRTVAILQSRGPVRSQLSAQGQGIRF